MGIDSEALHQEALKQQAARFEARISELLAERNAAQREVATLQAERDAAVGGQSVLFADLQRAHKDVDAARERAVAAEFERDRLSKLFSETSIERDNFKAELDEAQQGLTQLRFQANQAAINEETHGGSVTKPGWRARFAEFRRKFVTDAAATWGTLAHTALDAAEGFMEREADIVDAEFAPGEMIPERLASIIECLIEHGNEVADQLSEKNGERNGWNRQVKHVRAMLPKFECRETTRLEAENDVIARQVKMFREQRDAALRSRDEEKRCHADDTVKLVTAVGWIEMLCTAIAEGPLKKSAQQFVAETKRAKEIPF